VEFTSTGSLHDPAQLDDAVNLVGQAGVTDVLVLSHGWNNGKERARELYEELTDSLYDVGGKAMADQGRLVVIGVLWPAIRWADDGDIAGGGASIGGGDVDRIGESVEDPDTAAKLRALMPKLDTSAVARDEFLTLLRTLLPPAGESPDEDAVPQTLRLGAADTVFAAASGPDIELTDAPGQGDGAAATGFRPAGGAAATGFRPAGAVARSGAAGGAAGGFGPGDLRRAGRTLLNIATYYTMKARSGDVGERGVAGLLDKLSAAAPGVRLHLAGHSFGARVLSAAATRHQPIHSLTLLQAAFSHYGFAKAYDRDGSSGAFRAVLAPGRMAGPVLITHSAKDRAVGLAYAIASRLANQAGSQLGGPTDRFGGLGRNGAQKTDEVEQPGTELQQVGGSYTFAAGRVYNLKADKFVTSHGTVAGRQVAYALLQAILAGRSTTDLTAVRTSVG
jgi:hypothetical protein